MSGGVTPEARDLFTKTTREFFVFWAKIEPHLEQIRAVTRPGLFAGLESFCTALPDYAATLAMYKKFAAQIAERIARAEKIGRKKSGGKAKARKRR
jgi:hypothetical protein